MNRTIPWQIVNRKSPLADIILVSVLAWVTSTSCRAPSGDDSGLDAASKGVSTTFLKSVGSGKVLDVRDHGLKQGDVLQQWTYSKQKNQEWSFTRHDDQIFSIVSVRSGYCLELLDYSQDDNAPIAQKKCNGESTQKWQAVPTPEGYLLKNTWNYKCLSVSKQGNDNGAQVVLDQCTNQDHQFWTVAKEFSFDKLGEKPTEPQAPQKTTPSAPTPKTTPRIMFNPVIGIHTIKPAYQFTAEDPVVESVKVAFKMGFRMVKLDEKDRPALSAALSLPFSHVFLWYRTTKHWINGVTPEFRDTEYKETYKFVKTLRENPTLAGRSIFLGHWEGDWLLLGEGKAEGDAPDTGVKGMIEWFNLRQKAVDDAKKATPQSKVNIFHYAEVNRVRDAMVGGKKRMVNMVLPAIDVDYVSYSGYDVQQDTEATIHATLNYIEKNMRPRPSIPGKRVFIGEFGMGLQGKSREDQDRLNQQFIRRFLSWGTPYLLYWSLYETKANMDPTRKYALIDENNKKIPFALTMEQFLQNQLEYAKASGSGGRVHEGDMMQFVREQFQE